LEDSGIDERILNWIFRKWDMGLELIDLAQYRVEWKAVVDGTMNIPFP